MRAWWLSGVVPLNLPFKPATQMQSVLAIDRFNAVLICSVVCAQLLWCHVMSLAVAMNWLVHCVNNHDLRAREREWHAFHCFKGYLPQVKIE